MTRHRLEEIVWRGDKGTIEKHHPHIKKLASKVIKHLKKESFETLTHMQFAIRNAVFAAIDKVEDLNDTSKNDIKTKVAFLGICNLSEEDKE